MVAARRRSVAAPSLLASAFRPGEERATVPTERRPTLTRKKQPGRTGRTTFAFFGRWPPLPIVVARKAKARSGQARCSAARRQHDRPRLGCDGPAGAGARTQRLSAAPSSLGEISSRSGPPLSEGQPTGGPCLRGASQVERPEAIGSLRLREHTPPPLPPWPEPGCCPGCLRRSPASPVSAARLDPVLPGHYPTGHRHSDKLWLCLLHVVPVCTWPYTGGPSMFV